MTTVEIAVANVAHLDQRMVALAVGFAFNRVVEATCQLKVCGYYFLLYMAIKAMSDTFKIHSMKTVTKSCTFKVKDKRRLLVLIRCLSLGHASWLIVFC